MLIGKHGLLSVNSRIASLAIAKKISKNKEIEQYNKMQNVK